MRILLVEDDSKFLDAIVPDLEEIAGRENLLVAKSRQSAEAALDVGFFDLLVLDLTLPSIDGGLDKSADNGAKVFDYARGRAPGTPIHFLTRTLDENKFKHLLQRAGSDDVFGFGPMPLIDYSAKIDVLELTATLRSLEQRITQTDEIEIVTRGGKLDLSPQQKRVLRVFSRRRGGCLCDVKSLSGGLSDARVFRIDVEDSKGTERIRAVGKVADLAAVDDEVRRYDEHVVRLLPGAFPQIVDTVRAGAKVAGGAFYRLAEGYDRSLGEQVAPSSYETNAMVEVIAQLRADMRPWHQAGSTSTRPVAEIRRRLVNDDTAARLIETYDLQWATRMEMKAIQARWACIHGDLHAGNILVNRVNRPVLIDFADVEEGPPAADPITLELCFLFHPGFKHLSGDWPAEAVADRWANIDEFVEGCPFADLVRASRQWAHHVAAGDREVYAAAYAYLLRQLKYDGTDKDLGVRLLGAVRKAFEGTYQT
jgi:CheY-like chemotaxis protein